MVGASAAATAVAIGREPCASTGVAQTRSRRTIAATFTMKSLVAVSGRLPARQWQSCRRRRERARHARHPASIHRSNPPSLSYGLAEKPSLHFVGGPRKRTAQPALAVGSHGDPTRRRRGGWVRAGVHDGSRIASPVTSTTI